MSDKSTPPSLTAREQKMLAQAMQCLESELKVSPSHYSVSCHLLRLLISLCSHSLYLHLLQFPMLGTQHPHTIIFYPLCTLQVFYHLQFSVSGEAKKSRTLHAPYTRSVKA